MPVRLLDETSGDPEDYFLPADKLLAGNPKQQVRVQYTDPSGKFFAGVWASEPGKWKVAYTEEEYCELIEGMSVIADTAGASITVRAGDRFVVPRGFTGTWETVTYTRKYFVVYEPGE